MGIVTVMCNTAVTFLLSLHQTEIDGVMNGVMNGVMTCHVSSDRITWHGVMSDRME